MADQYQMLEELGSGSFGIVYKALERSTGDLVAIKHIDLEGSDDDIREIQQEIALLSTCASPFVTQYRTSFVRGVKLWIVMEFLGGGSCLDLLKPGPFAEPHIAIIMRELLHGLHYLHATGKIHRDIKAANVLLSSSASPKVKIADFGVAAQLTNIKSQRMTFVGTPFWMAPEVIQEMGYDFKADIWSLGITAMEMALGAPPRADTHPMKVLMQIPKLPPPRLEGSEWSRDFRDFVEKCLVKDPDRRPTSKELLRHRFIRNAGKLEQLRGLIDRYQTWDEGSEKGIHPKYYEETLQDLSPKLDQDEWVFDTVKPTTAASPAKPAPRPCEKRRRLARIDSAMDEDESEDHIAPSALLERVDLNANSAESPPPLRPSNQDGQTVRKPSVSGTPTARRVSAIRITSGSSSPTARRVSGVGAAAKQPLGLDMSFGNGTSTVRQFRRVSADRLREQQQQQQQHSQPNNEVSRPRRKESAAPSPTKQPRTPGAKQQQPQQQQDLSNLTNPWEKDHASSYVWDENTPPPPVTQDFAVPPTSTPASATSKYSTPPSQPQPAPAPLPAPRQPAPPPPPPGLACVTKESQLARQAYLSAIDPSFGEILAQTADPARRGALAQLAQAWSTVNQLDPEGEWALLCALFARLGGNQRLSAALRGGRGAVDGAAGAAAAPLQPRPPLQERHQTRRNRRKSRGLEEGTGVPTPTPSVNPSPGNAATVAAAAASSASAADTPPPPPPAGLRRANTTANTPAAAASSIQQKNTPLPHQDPSPKSPRKQANTNNNNPTPPTTSAAPAINSQANRRSDSTSNTSTNTSAPKLLLSRNNPHLKSHRRRQSAFVTPSSGGYAGPLSPPKNRSRSSGREDDENDDDLLARPDARTGWLVVDERKLPGHVERGLEHQGLLADVLYGRWVEGLRGRWGAVG